MEHKSFPVTDLKAIGGSDEPGTFEAIVAVFGNVDTGGDRLERGAFKRTLKERGLPPIVWSHNWDVPPIGVVSEAVENNEGLRIKGRLFVGEDEDSPLARQVYTAMKATDGNGKAPLREFSFGYAAKEYAMEGEDEQKIRVLKDVELFEVGPTLIGMNPATRLMAVKAACEPQDKQEPVDKPEPKSTTPVDEEAQARIDALLHAQPINPQDAQGATP